MDAKATAFAQELRNAPAQLCRFDVERTCISSSFVHETGDPHDNDVITKSSTRRVFDAAYNACIATPGARVLLEGQQGIGKSRGLLYLLKKLLEISKLVVYQDCDRSVFYAFVPLSPTSYE
jgi:predicted ATP-dependent serine protease